MTINNYIRSFFKTGKLEIWQWSRKVMDFMKLWLCYPNGILKKIGSNWKSQQYKPVLSKVALGLGSKFPLIPICQIFSTSFEIFIIYSQLYATNNWNKWSIPWLNLRKVAFHWFFSFLIAIFNILYTTRKNYDIFLIYRVSNEQLSQQYNM